MILTGKHLGAQDALRIGLVDRMSLIPIAGPKIETKVVAQNPLAGTNPE